MSEETINYLVYETLDDALVKADAEGARRGYAYHRVGSGTRYKTYPKVTADAKYALVVDGYELTDDETTAIVTDVTFPVEEE
jgi:hypothetical protein|tara:strand:- start:46 stop:291 length:246 start_codon:yes stop_codon:yes gene_type:complete